MRVVHTSRPVSERSLTELLRAAIEARAAGLVLLRDRDGLRHGLWVEGGYVVGVHVAGRFDPLLELLFRGGLLSSRSHRSCVEALTGRTDRSGELATSLAGVPSVAVREALRRQVVSRFVALLELAQQHGYDARLEPGDVPGSERSVRMPLGSLLRQVEQAALGEREQARRTLRSLALALHPDRHAHLDREARERMERELAQATAAYHGFAARPAQTR